MCRDTCKSDFDSVVSRLGGVFDDVLFLELLALLQDRERHYHNLHHVSDCLRIVGDFSPSQEFDSVRLALWYHDAVYSPTMSDNEARSAELAQAHLKQMGVSDSVREDVSRLITLTARQRRPKGEEEMVMADVDFSILGRDWGVYSCYAQNVRKEYSHLGDVEFEKGRRSFLENLLNQGCLFYHPWFRSHYEDRARANISRELTSSFKGVDGC